MVVYLDVFLLYNTLVNIFILYLSAHFIKIKIKWFNILYFTLVDVVALIVCSVYLPAYFSAIYKILHLFAVCAICINTSTLKVYLKFIITYLLISVLLAGLMLSLKYSTLIHSGFTIPTGIIVCTGILFVCVYKTIINYFASCTRYRNNYHEVTICHQGVKIKMLGYNDSGNSLLSETTGLPVFVSDEECLKPILVNKAIVYETINCQTILQNGCIRVFLPDLIYVNGRLTRAVIGISPVSLNADYDILLNNNLKFSETEKTYA